MVQFFDRLLSSDNFKLKLNELRLVQKFKKREQKVKVSIIMPTWNRAFIIERAIDSVLRQSYTNYELIISDDGSSDDTEGLIKTNYGKDDSIIYVKNRHLGVSHTRNVGLKYSTGQLIAYLDSDNAWSENYLLLMVNSFIENPVVNTMYCGIRVTENTNINDFMRFRKYDRDSLLSRNYIDLNIFMHRRFLFERLGGFNESLKALVDWELIIRYTKDHPPYLLECCLAIYYFEKDFGHLSSTEDLDKPYRQIRKLHNE